MGVVLITGGGSGIGAGLAAAFHARGSQVIVAGHGRERVEAVAACHPGMEAEVVDVADPEQVVAIAERVGERWPELTTVISNATGLDTRLAEDPLTCVARGTSVYLENLELWKDTMESDHDEM